MKRTLLKKVIFITLLFLPFFTQAEDLFQTYKDAGNSSMLKKDLAQMTKAQGQRFQAISYLLPHISTDLTYAYNWSETMDFDWDNLEKSNEQETDFKNLRFGIQASQVLFDSRAYLGMASAAKGFKAAEAVYADSKQTLILNSAKAYFGVLRAEDLLDSMQAEEKAIKKQLDAINERYKAGLVAMTEKHQVQAAYDKVKSLRINAETLVLSTYGDLQQLTEKDYANLDKLKAKIKLIHPTPDNAEHWQKQALANNLSLKAAKKQLEARTINKHPHVYPSLSLFARYEFDDNIKGMDKANHNASIGINLKWDIFNGGKAYADMLVNKGFWVDSYASYEILKRKINYGTQTLFNKVKGDIAKAEAAEQALKSNRSILRAMQYNYNNGLNSIIDLLNSQKNLHASQREFSNARYDYIIDYLELKSMTASLTAEDVKTFNAWLE